MDSDLTARLDLELLSLHKFFGYGNNGDDILISLMSTDLLQNQPHLHSELLPPYERSDEEWLHWFEKNKQTNKHSH